MLESAIIVPDGGSVINSVKSKLGKNGMFFLTVTTASDIPENFNYCSGLVVHRSDTMSIILFDRYYGKIAVNSLTSTVSDNKWTDWQIFVTNNDLYEMPYVYNTSLKTYLKNYLKNGYYKIMFFGSLTDNPFKNITYGILLAAYATSYGEHAKLVGVNPETGVIESVSMDIR